jgi:enoyl-CoA hydratase/carnithine racemase
MLLTGDPIDADRGYAAGLVNVVTEPGGALDAAIALAERICANAPVAVQASMAAIHRLLGADDEFGWGLTDDAKAAVLASDDYREGVAAFLEKRQPRWSGG